jgi:hypothetical protein
MMPILLIVGSLSAVALIAEVILVRRTRSLWRASPRRAKVQTATAMTAFVVIPLALLLFRQDLNAVLTILSFSTVGTLWCYVWHVAWARIRQYVYRRWPS